MYLTYELWSPIDNKIFYVGAGLSDRPQAHLNEYHTISKGGWTGKKDYNRKKYEAIKQIIISEQEIIIKIVLETDNREKAFQLEMDLIKQYGRKDLDLGPLTNMTDGGDGGDTFSGKSDEEKRLIIEKRQGKNDNFAGAKKWYESLTKDEQVKWHREQAEKRTFDWYVSRLDDGIEILIHNLHQWCKDNKIDVGSASAASNPESIKYGKSVGGWRIRRADQPPLPPYKDRRQEGNNTWAKGTSWKKINGKRVYVR